MLKRSIVAGLAVCIVAILLVSQSFSAGGAGGRGGAGARGGAGGRAGAGQRTQRDPAEMQRLMNERMKEQLGATDEQWKDIQPRLQKVMTLSRQVSAPGRGMMFGGPGGFGGRRQPGTARTRGQDTGDRTRTGTTRRAQAQQTAVGKATAELQEVLRNEEATADQIKEKLAALRTAKDKAQKELAAAQKELKEKLTVKQEAFLVLSGYLN